MPQPTTVTIGIPAYNEGENIGPLIGELLTQDHPGLVLEKIIVASDGSTDKTVEEVRRFSRDDITVIDNPKREGIGPRLNQLLGSAQSDVLVILNADVAIRDPRFLEKLTAPLLSDGAHMTSCDVLPLPPRTFVGRALSSGFRLKNDLFEEWRNGDNVYTCHGTARAFSRPLYQEIRFPESIAEDAFSYFFSVAHGYRYRYVPKTGVFIRLPETFADHVRQSTRFRKTKEVLSSLFPVATVTQTYRIPLFLLWKHLVFQSFRTPLSLLGYIGIQLLTRMRESFGTEPVTNVWTIAQSSKYVRN